MLESMDLLKVSAPTIYRSVHRVYILFLLRKISLYTSIKSEHCLLLTILTMLKEQSAVFYVTPHWVSNERIIFPPKLEHLFFPLLHYFYFHFVFEYILYQLWNHLSRRNLNHFPWPLSGRNLDAFASIFLFFHNIRILYTHWNYLSRSFLIYLLKLLGK